MLCVSIKKLLAGDEFAELVLARGSKLRVSDWIK
jgi:hypothetical protein